MSIKQHADGGASPVANAADRSADSGADTRLFVGLVLVGMIVFAVAVAVGSALGSKPGSLADWVAAVSTFAALLAAAYAAVQTRRTFGLEQGRDAERVEQERRAQAVQVAVWTGQMQWVGPVVIQTTDSAAPIVASASSVVRPESIPVHVLNASPVPVWHLRVEIYVGASTASEAVCAASFQVESRANGIALVGQQPVMDAATPEVVGDMVRALEEVPGADAGPTRTWFGWSFQDNAGQWWRRFPTGALAPLDGPPASAGQRV